MPWFEPPESEPKKPASAVKITHEYKAVNNAAPELPLSQSIGDLKKGPRTTKDPRAMAQAAEKFKKHREKDIMSAVIDRKTHAKLVLEGSMSNAAKTSESNLTNTFAEEAPVSTSLNDNTNSPVPSDTPRFTPDAAETDSVDRVELTEPDSPKDIDMEDMIEIPSTSALEQLHSIRGTEETLTFSHSSMIRAKVIATFLNDNQAQLLPKIEAELERLGYAGGFMLQAGFNEDFLHRGIEYQEVFVVLTQEINFDELEVSRYLPQLFHPHTAVLSTPSQVYHLPSLQDLRPVKSSLSPVDHRLNVLHDLSQRFVGLWASGGEGSSNLSQGDKSDSEMVPSDNLGEESTGDESAPQVGNEKEPKIKATNLEDGRRLLLLHLRAPLTVESALHSSADSSGSNFTFNLGVHIELELSSNRDGKDSPKDLHLRDPWCFLNFASLTISSQAYELYSLSTLDIHVEATPHQTGQHQLPIVQHETSDETKHQREVHLGRKFGLTAGNKGIGLSLEASGLKVVRTESMNRRWTITPHCYKDSRVKNAVVVQSRYRHNPSASDNEGRKEVIVAENFEPGPHIVFSSKSETGRTIRIDIKSFWKSTGKQTVNRSKLVKILNRFEEENQRPPFIFANFFHEMSFEVDLGKITGADTENLYGENSEFAEDLIEARWKKDDQPALDRMPVKITPREGPDRESPAFFIPLKRSVIEAIRGEVKGKWKGKGKVKEGVGFVEGVRVESPPSEG